MILVSAEWLLKVLDDPAAKVFDASWCMPSANRNTQAEYAEAHIPGAQFFDIDAISEADSPYPHTLPSSELFENIAAELGINRDDHIVIYEGAGLFSAPRAWWMFRVFGHTKVSILSGGLDAWRSAGGVLVAGLPPTLARGNFNAVFQRDRFATTEDVLKACDDPATAILDARSVGRFAGIEPEPRPNIPSGHMPSAINVPFSRCVDKTSGRLLDANALENMLIDSGVPAEGDVIASCGSGITACVLAIALEQIGRTCRVYDGSWAQWASEDNPVLRAS